MEHFEVYEGYREPEEGGISLKYGRGRIFSVLRMGDRIEIREGCDDYFSVELSREKAIEVFTEALEWIKGSEL